MARIYAAYLPGGGNRYKSTLNMKKLLTKKDLCQIFGLYSQRSNQMYYKALRDKVMTNDLLLKIGLTPETYRFKKVFSAQQTQIIIETLKIEKGELED